MSRGRQDGFTLIELSIVLVIIGLIVGGVLTGQSLIAAAAVRAQITQIEKFNTAANTFYGKYGYLPGDMPSAPAAQFGFVSRGAYAGEGDGNGILEGNASNSAGGNSGITAECGENITFWVDLSTAKIIDGGFATATEATPPGNIYLTSSPPISAYIPDAKIGNGNSVYIYSYDGRNYFGISSVNIIGYGLGSVPTMTVSQAYNIDKKVDDGLPQSGNLLAQYQTNVIGFPIWSNGVSAANGPYTTATTGSSTTCYDNGGSSSNPMTYSINQNNGSGANCGISWHMQAGD